MHHIDPLLSFSQNPFSIPHQRFEAILDTINDAIWSGFMLPTFRLTYANMAVIKIYGYTPEEFLADSGLFDRLLHPDDRERTMKIFMTVITEKHAEDEFRIIHANGQVRWLHVRAWLEENPEDERLRQYCSVHGITKDITAYKEMERKLQTYHNEMERLVCQRTKELEETNHKLMQNIEEKQKYIRIAEEYNITLKNVLEKMKEKEGEINERLAVRISQNIIPLMEKMKKGHHNEVAKKAFEVLEEGIRSLLSENAPLNASVKYKLTLTEIRVARLVSEGLQAKEIAETCNISLFTVNNHIGHIRKKLGLRNQGVNLKTFLKGINL